MKKCKWSVGAAGTVEKERTYCFETKQNKCNTRLHLHAACVLCAET